MAFAKAGTVFKFVAPTKEEKEDWRFCGHNFHQQGGVKAIEKRSVMYAMLLRRVAYITTESLPKGDKGFSRISWTNAENELETLVQYIGKEDLSELQAVNKKSTINKKPRNHLPPSVLRTIERTPIKARELNEQMTRAAGADLNKQLLLTPRNDLQIRQLQYLHRKREITEDQYTRLFKISCEYPTMKLFALKPRFLLVLAEPEMIEHTREVLREVSWQDSREQVVSYDTQFDLGNFYLSTLTLKDTRMTTSSGSRPTIPAFFVVHERKLMWDHDLAFRTRRNTGSIDTWFISGVFCLWQTLE